MTDELNKLSPESDILKPEDAVPAYLNEMHPIGEDVDSDVEDDDMSCKVTVELLPDWLKPMEEEDVGVDELMSAGRINRRKTKEKPPKVKRGRGRPPKRRHGLTLTDYKKGLHADRTMKKKRVGSLMNRKRPHLSRKATSVPDPSHKAEVLPRTRQRVVRSSTSTPQSPEQVPDSPAGDSSAEFNSPPQLTRVSPPSIDTSRRSFIHSPSVKVGNVTQQIISTEPGKDASELPLRLWLCPSLEPISPTQTQEMLSEQTVGSPNFPEASLNGTMTVKESLPFLSQCEGCGCPFSAQKPGDTLCYRCRIKNEKKRSPPNILCRKQKPQRYGKTENLDIVPDGGDDDDDDYWRLKKRNRRMCQRCDACRRDADCGKCDFCMDKPKFGGSNTKRQKCRLRQCKFQSKLQFRNGMNGVPTLPPIRKMIKSNKILKIKKRGRPPKKKFKNDPWEEEEDDYEASDNDEDDQELRSSEMNGTQVRKHGKWSYTFKEDEDDAAYVEDVVDANVEEDSVILDNERSVMASNEMYSNTSGLSSQGLYYNVSGMPVSSHLIGSAPLCNSGAVAMGEVIGSVPMADEMSQNGFLQIEMVRVGSSPSHYREEQQNTQHVHMADAQQEQTPVITQIFSLAGPETESDRDPGLIELFTSLGQSVLPAHWVCVIAKGPVLQLLQCSKLSTMADTVVQIEKGFFYQVTVQNQPLLLMHSLYSRHPTCLEKVEHVVSLLLDLEALGVCQGYQNLQMCLPWEPKMCVRAALCDLLIPKDEEHCGKCSQPVEG
ncbi:methyl-CpG-binding domain protein 1a isoform X2 [Danio aesculapii]|uniref:methyl-CpG-binding domain protein 1a isoform X2 n=1 Tax=Danio aesculapii TaxID=1142201 RepID=UPI0024C09C18|nr:methyl-CpG-binding domain protein 1a isoform X2 [Danio aesculapii]